MRDADRVFSSLPEAEGGAGQPHEAEIRDQSHHDVGKHKVQLRLEVLPPLGVLGSTLGCHTDSDLQQTGEGFQQSAQFFSWVSVQILVLV